MLKRNILVAIVLFGCGEGVAPIRTIYDQQDAGTDASPAQDAGVIDTAPEKPIDGGTTEPAQPEEEIEFDGGDSSDGGDGGYRCLPKRPECRINQHGKWTCHPKYSKVHCKDP